MCCGYLEAPLGIKGAFAAAGPTCSCTGLGFKSHQRYRPGLGPLLPAAGTQDGGPPWTGNPQPSLGAEPCSQDRAGKQAGSLLPRRPCSPLAPRGEQQHLGVTSRKDQPLNRTTTRTRQDGSAKTCTHIHTCTYAQGRESRRDAHLLELLSLSLVFDVTPSAKQPERPPSEGAQVEGTGAAQLSPSTTDPGQGSTSLPKNPRPSTCWDEPVLHGQGSISHTLLGNQGRAGGCLATLGKAGVPGWGCLASMGRRAGAGLPRPRERRWSECMGRRVLAGGTGAACTWGAGEGTAQYRHWDGGPCL